MNKMSLTARDPTVYKVDHSRFNSGSRQEERADKSVQKFQTLNRDSVFSSVIDGETGEATDYINTSRDLFTVKRNTETPNYFSRAAHSTA